MAPEGTFQKSIEQEILLMKLTLLQEPNVPETEITIRYTWPDSQPNHRVELNRQRGVSLVG